MTNSNNCKHCYYHQYAHHHTKIMNANKVRQLTLGEGTTEKVFMIRSGYSSRILEMRRVPMPEPVPPPSEWVSWNPAEGHRSR